MKVSDVIAATLCRHGIKTVFGVTGGAAAHLFDSANLQGIACVFTHHEQSAAFAAGSYARINGLGAAFFTTGPGGTNALTGVAAAWVDSIPTIYIGGQVRLAHLKAQGTRQRGTQEIDVLSMIRPIVKYGVRVEAAEDILYELEKCIYLAQAGRPGPVYLEVPLDIQWTAVDGGSLRSFEPPLEVASSCGPIDRVAQELSLAKRPLLLIGQGVKLAGATSLAQSLHIPFLTTWNAVDSAITHSSIHLGCPGMFGSREANMALFSCDFLLALGTHLPISITTDNYTQFAPKAFKILVNIDPHELENQRVHIDLPICSDVSSFLKNLLPKVQTEDISPWKTWCSKIKGTFRQTVRNGPLPETYDVLLALNELSQEGDIIVIDGGGTIVHAAFQTLQLKKGQRLIIDAGLCSMGSGLPQAIGAAFSKPARRIICLCGDGSFQFNVQELQTIHHHKLDMKLLVFNNDGYLSIRHTQDEFFDKRHVGSSRFGGISFPDITAVATAYRLPTQLIAEREELFGKLGEFFAYSGPAICEIKVSSTQTMNPKMGFDLRNNQRRTMADMWPYLEESELMDLLTIEG